MTVVVAQTNPWASTFGSDTSVITWSGLGNDVSGAAVRGVGYTDRVIQFEGTFNGATVTLEGSNDGTNFHTLHDAFGTLLSYTVASLAEVTEACIYMRPTIIGGDGSTAITATLSMTRHP